MIKAITTVYDGHKFRSRLEARWAVYFNALGLQYEYELEGFRLSGGVSYLPDFYIPSLRIHAEVKPSSELARSDLEKISKFSVEGDKSLLLIVGSPTNEEMYLISRASLLPWEDLCSAADDDEGLLQVFWESVRDWGHVQLAYLPQRNGLHLVYKTLPPMADYDLTSSLLKAKQARFEFGETPQ